MYQREQIGLMHTLLWWLHCTLCRIYWIHIVWKHFKCSYALSVLCCITHDNPITHSLTHGLPQLHSCDWRCTRPW